MKGLVLVFGRRGGVQGKADLQISELSEEQWLVRFGRRIWPLNSSTEALPCYFQDAREGINYSGISFQEILHIENSERRQ